MLLASLFAFAAATATAACPVCTCPCICPVTRRLHEPVCACVRVCRPVSAHVLWLTRLSPALRLDLSACLLSLLCRCQGPVEIAVCVCVCGCCLGAAIDPPTLACLHRPHTAHRRCTAVHARPHASRYATKQCVCMLDSPSLCQYSHTVIQSCNHMLSYIHIATCYDAIILLYIHAYMHSVIEHAQRACLVLLCVRAGHM